jgi:A/G-specific adenine glycosylase
MDLREVAKAVEGWARQNLESLPWRSENDLYRLLIAEILLKRTTRKAAARAYLQFISRFPTLDALCDADVAEVEEILRPIGLYRQRSAQLRELCLHREALKRARSWRDLVKLPGVGEYTAKAIASVLFGERVVGVDSNVKRVLTRLFGRFSPALAEELAQYAGDPRLLQLGLVDLGYRVCQPRRPRCGACPLKGLCASAPTRHPVGRQPPGAHGQP